MPPVMTIISRITRLRTLTDQGRQVTMTGNKNVWCVMDLQSLDGSTRCDQYTCQNQGSVQDVRIFIQRALIVSGST